jgi:hypothetical protein
MKTDTKPKYTLGNGEKMCAEHPETFYMPERKDREALKPGKMVKCMFLPLKVVKGLPGGDRMWVTITAVREDGTYLGRLENCPMVVDAAMAMTWCSGRSTSSISIRTRPMMTLMRNGHVYSPPPPL